MREDIADFVCTVGITILIMAASTLLVWGVWLAVDSIGVVPTAVLTAVLGLAVGVAIVAVGRRMW